MAQNQVTLRPLLRKVRSFQEIRCGGLRKPNGETPLGHRLMAPAILTLLNNIVEIIILQLLDILASTKIKGMNYVSR